MARRVNRPTFRRTPRPATGMTLTFAQVRWAYKKIYGVKMGFGMAQADADKAFQGQADEMFKTHGEAGILAAIADYDREAYINSTDI